MSASVEAAAAACLARLPQPGPAPDDEPWWAHSLAQGTTGIALVHVERARLGTGTWRQAHAWIRRACAGGPVSAGDDAGLFQGLPAVAFLLRATARYGGGLADTAGPLAAIAHRRADALQARVAAGIPATFREYDVFFGLAGLGALLLRLDPGGGATERVLTSLVALTRPRREQDVWLPGWWVGHDPHRRNSSSYPGGHANLGMAHGVTGPLALLAIAARAGHTVDGHTEAIAVILDFLDSWRQDGPHSLWWPQWITRRDLVLGRPSQTGPGRPSWCYGTPGIARAGQLAALAIGDPAVQHRYEDALAACLADFAQQELVTDPGLCHGAAGLYQTVRRAAEDAVAPTLTSFLPQLAGRLARRASDPRGHGPGFLDGDAGAFLALSSAQRPFDPPSSEWDTCLLLALRPRTKHTGASSSSASPTKPPRSPSAVWPPSWTAPPGPVRGGSSASTPAGGCASAPRPTP
ncbi:lanthionine synthetase C family protein [Actinocorallia sp. API 0066]|uniref:lanthionine synthetase C family protein n=1 Tax=Actinocorallia sp. API 0066 TaxID=2896846 RepID=UPI001E31576F|nr:lanthionine synthetase C family protein [Actinocorallia sp. API 0066]MCD0449332.1 lanthionine synthetase C family protein [Actinocorallia sp. API 0066]